MRDPVPSFVDALGGGVRGLRMAWSTGLGYANIDPEVASIASDAARVFEELGSTVDDPNFVLDDPVPAFLAIFYTGNYTSYGHLLNECPDMLSDNGRICLEQGRQVTGADYARAIRSVDVMKAKIDDGVVQGPKSRIEIILSETQSIITYHYIRILHFY